LRRNPRSQDWNSVPPEHNRRAISAAAGGGQSNLREESSFGDSDFRIGGDEVLLGLRNVWNLKLEKNPFRNPDRKYVLYARLAASAYPQEDKYHG
jgi:hypothetical protein